MTTSTTPLPSLAVIVALERTVLTGHTGFGASPSTILVMATLVTTDAFGERLVSMPEQINDLIQVQKAPETMSFLELRGYITRLAETGHHVSRYLVQLDSKLSFPLVHVIMALVAIPFALASPRSGGRGVGIAVAILISVGYWVVNSVAIAFAKA